MFLVTCATCGKRVGAYFEAHEGPDGEWHCDEHDDHPTATRTPLPIVREDVRAVFLRDRTEPAGFDGPEEGSEERYDRRASKVPWAQHTFWWFIHNAVAHPLIAILPHRALFRFHDWTSYRMHGQKGPSR